MQTKEVEFSNMLFIYVSVEEISRSTQHLRLAALKFRKLIWGLNNRDIHRCRVTRQAHSTTDIHAFIISTQTKRWNSILKRMQISIFFNSLATELCFSLIFEMYIKIDFSRLPTHRRDAHKKFVQLSLLISK